MGWNGVTLFVGLLLVAACQTSPPPPLIVPVPPPARVFAAPDTVWTARDAIVLRTASGDTLVPRPFTRLDVLDADSLSLQVRCTACGDSVVGWVSRAAVIHVPIPLDSAAAGDLAQFALAVRAAAIEQDQVALRRVMALDFSFSAIGTYGRDRALAAWFSENSRSLDRVPGLLDAGLTSLNGSWVAPPAFASSLDYRGLRLGFRRTPAGRWEWLFLVQGENP